MLTQSEIKYLITFSSTKSDSNNNTNSGANDICYIECENEVNCDKEALLERQVDARSDADTVFKRYLKLYENIGKLFKTKYFGKLKFLIIDQPISNHLDF